MKKPCNYSRMYEQIGDNKLVLCLKEDYCLNQGPIFTSSEDGKEYIICKTSGITLSGIEKLTGVSEFGNRKLTLNLQ